MTSKMSEKKSAERRRWPRTDVVLKIAYQEPQDLLSDYITNLGEGGLFIYSNLNLEVGQTLQFALSFPGLLDPIELAGTIRWHRAFDPNTAEEPPGFGVEFIFPGENQKQQILNLLATLRDKNPTWEVDEKQPFRVLLVEDNEFTLKLFDYAIKRFHAERIGKGVLEILHAADGQEALDVLGGNDIDMALVDHFLPMMNGCTLVQHMRNSERTRHLPIVVISVGEEDVKRLAHSSGADLFLKKPVLHKQLIETLMMLLTRKQAAMATGGGE